MLPYDIAAIRAVHSDRIQRDLASRHVHHIRRVAPSRPIRRAIGRSMVRIGEWLAQGEAAASPSVSASRAAGGR